VHPQHRHPHPPTFDDAAAAAHTEPRADARTLATANPDAGATCSGSTSLPPADGGSCTIAVNYFPANADAGPEQATLGVTGASGGSASDTLTATGR